MTQSLSGIPPSALHQIAQHPAYTLDTSPEFLKQEPVADGSPDFSAFDAAYDMGTFGTGGPFDLASQSTDLNATQALWADQFQDGHF